MKSEQLQQVLATHFGDQVDQVLLEDMVTIELSPENLVSVCQNLRDDPQFKFEQCMDICGVDYQDYGISHWRTDDTTASGFSRAVKQDDSLRVIPWDKSRYAAVYHLLSITHNHRVRLKVYLQEEPTCPSVIDVWASANWYEREAFDLMGIVFDGHPDLRRILTDYGFKGHPFRKDFPLVGEVEMRYDAKLERCVYEPVSTQPRVLVPKVIRKDNRYVRNS